MISDPVYPVDEEADASSFQDAAEGLVGFATLDEHELEFLRFISSAPDYRGPRTDRRRDCGVQAASFVKGVEVKGLLALGCSMLEMKIFCWRSKCSIVI